MAQGTAVPTIQVTWRDVASLRPDPDNPRIHSKKQIKQIARSIQTFGFNAPLLIDRTGKLLAGHGRLEACKQLGMTLVPTISLDHLSDSQARAYMLADNKLAQLATWDDRLLGEHFKELAKLNLDFSIEDTGFEMGEIDLLIQDSEGVVPDDADDMPAAGLQVCVRGDLWFLGPHRIFCGNSLEAQSYTRLLDGKRAAGVFTDPPYNVTVHGHVCGLGGVKHREFAMASGEMTPKEYAAFLGQVFARAVEHCADGSLHYICMDWRHLEEISEAGRGTYDELKNVCVWTKHNAGMGSLYRSQHELIFVFKQGKAPHRNNVQLGKNGRYRTNVWSYPGANTVGGPDQENLLALHPTVKPVAMVADAILDSTARGDLVLDPFLGSGTTILAAHKTGRVGYGIEIDPAYVDVAIRRWQALSGESAQHANGRLFRDVEAESKKDSSDE
ncbi:MAG TPA: DNA methyltransferase [Solimonas sp.]